MPHKTMSFENDKIAHKAKKLLKSWITTLLPKVLDLKPTKNSNINDIIELISQFNDHGNIEQKIKDHFSKESYTLTFSSVSLGNESRCSEIIFK